MGKYAEIVGWGKYVPNKVLSNADLERVINTTDDWIRTRTGIQERRIASPKETCSTMATKAAHAAIEVADLRPTKIDLVIVATISPDYPFPATASIVQDALGATNAGALDISVGCAGFVYALSIANAYIAAGIHRHVLVIGSETLSRIVDFSDRGTGVLFGDGAGAVLLQESDKRTGMLSCVLGSDGSGVDLLYVPGGGGRNPASIETVQNRMHFIKMKGNEVYRFAVNVMVKASQQAVKNAGLTMEDIDLFVPHQANLRIIQSAAKTLKLPEEKVFTNVERYGNTSAASVPIALCEAIEQGRVSPGDHLVLVAFGGGLSWASAVIQWGVPAVVPRVPWWKAALHNFRSQEAAARSLVRRAGRRITG
ncbi:MAG: ketoacyl-ACP synthase III [Chloroflexi bacterium]|nr:ketoacyl-ACP synthase III [Chloroflexota bacterium]